MSSSFADLGLGSELADACARLGYKAPTEIQRLAIPPALAGEDVIGLAQTGSGKTAAFVLPVLHALLDAPQPGFACILEPTRELVYQVCQQIEALGGAELGVRTAVIIGGVDMMQQAIQLAKGPHIIVATPGRLLDHLESTKGFSLRRLRYLVLDEADRLLDYDFGPKIEKILQELPVSAKDARRTLLFSATMTDKVAKLQRACISRTPVKVSALSTTDAVAITSKEKQTSKAQTGEDQANCEKKDNDNDEAIGKEDKEKVVQKKYETVSRLVQEYCFFPLKQKDLHLVFVLSEHTGQPCIIFANTVASVQRITLILRNLAFNAVPLHGQLRQSERLSALTKFKAGIQNILVATDVAARGLDLPEVDLVLNYEIPMNTKLYVHRVGRTARAGRSGRSITFVTQYDVEQYQRIEALIGLKMPEYKVNKKLVLSLAEKVNETCAIAATQMREHQANLKRKRKGSGREQHDTEDHTDEPIGNGTISAVGAKYEKTNNCGGGKRHRKK